MFDEKKKKTSAELGLKFIYPHAIGVMLYIK